MLEQQQVTIVSNLTDIDWHKWDSYVLNHPHGTVFHLSKWQNVIHNTFKHSPMHLAAKDADGNIIGLLPIFLVRSLIFGHMLISTPQAAYGGILSNDEIVTESLLAEAQKIARQENVEFLELRNFRNSIDKSELPTKDLYVTFRQELFADPEKNFLAIPRKTRAECRQGIQNGLEFKVNAISVDEFFKIYGRSVRDLGTPVFSKKLFANGLQQFGDECQIFSVHYEGKPVSAVWTLFYKDEVLPYYGGSIREYNHLGTNNFMYWMLIKHGCETGYKIYDFGRSKKGTGSFDFKKRWGQEMSDLPYQYFLVQRSSMPDTSPLNPKLSLGVTLWRKLPLSMANRLGPVIANHLI